MNSAPHLLTEDRPEFERVLDDALRAAHDHPELAAIGERLNPEQLRTMALNAAALIATAAAAEYQHFVKLRDEYRNPAPVNASSQPEHSGGGSVTLATTVGEVAETTGAGLVAVIAVLAPVLAGTAAAIFLLVGFLLKMVTPEPAFADTMLTAGWLFTALTAAGILVAGIGLLLTALRNGASSLQATGDAASTKEMALAREAWRQALLERGILPFLGEALTDPATPPTPTPLRRPNPDGAGRPPQLGYSRPGFSSPSGDGSPAAGPRPSYSSPDFSSPDYGGPDHQPD